MPRHRTKKYELRRTIFGNFKLFVQSLHYDSMDPSDLNEYTSWVAASEEERREFMRSVNEGKANVKCY